MVVAVSRLQNQWELRLVALLEKDRIRIEEQSRENRAKALEQEVLIGKSAERLLNNPDWLRYSGEINLVVGQMVDREIDGYNHILSQSETTAEEDHIACQRIRKAKQEMDNFKYLLRLPEMQAEVGRNAQSELDKIRGEDHAN